jgi:hypothetical protein
MKDEQYPSLDNLGVDIRPANGRTPPSPPTRRTNWKRIIETLGRESPGGWFELPNRSRGMASNLNKPGKFPGFVVEASTEAVGDDKGTLWLKVTPDEAV